ncbi:MAG: UDP-3-O-(3-hydroxymyristoyl)glucosamine N-acyltransferase [Anaerolineae bacterium]|nr:UDP-3-O-(3-hydroxymyristoyl)glucosamine N-acyltransferase [Anaerolineae bacterium]
MKLNQMNRNELTRVARDGEFESLGFVTHKSPAMLVFLENEKFLPALLNNSTITCVITSEQLAEQLPKQFGVAVSPNPRRAFYTFHNWLATETDFYWTGFPTTISKSASIHPTAYVADRDVRIGERVLIEPNVTVLGRVIIEDDVIIRAGTVVGSEGFEFNLIDGEILAVVHGGGVRIGRRVEIQSNTCVDRAVFGGFTEIGEDTKIDNLIHIAHNVRIGKRCRMAALAMIGGSVTMGDDVWVGPSVSISSEITIGDGASLTLGAVVTRDVVAGQRVTGNFAIEHDKFIAFIKSIR